jgi:hypothetical protein
MGGLGMRWDVTERGRAQLQQVLQEMDDTL